MTLVAVRLSEATVSLSVDAQNKPSWTVGFEAKRSGYEDIPLSTGGHLLGLPGSLWLTAGDPDKEAVGSIHHWPKRESSWSDSEERFNIQCMVPTEQFRQIIDSIERGRPPLAVTIIVPTINMADKWEVGEGDLTKDTWHPISRASFLFDEHPEPEYAEPEPEPVPMDKLIASGLGWLRLDLAKYAMIGGGLLVALIVAVLWRG